MTLLEAQSTLEADGPCVLVVSIRADEREALRALLEAEGFCTWGAEGLVDAQEMCGREWFDLIVLDGRLGDGGALAVCRQLAVAVPAPIIMISEKADVTERVIALEVGADTLISRPLNDRELLASARALLRRCQSSRRTAGAAPRLKTGARRTDRIVLDLGTRRLEGFDGRSVRLTDSLLIMLRLFIAHCDQPVSTESLSEELNFAMTSTHLRTLIARLRRRLTEVGLPSDVIATVTSRGYYMSKAYAEMFEFEYQDTSGQRKAVPHSDLRPMH